MTMNVSKKLLVALLLVGAAVRNISYETPEISYVMDRSNVSTMSGTWGGHERCRLNLTSSADALFALLLFESTTLLPLLLSLDGCWRLGPTIAMWRHIYLSGTVQGSAATDNQIEMAHLRLVLLDDSHAMAYMEFAMTKVFETLKHYYWSLEIANLFIISNVNSIHIERIVSVFHIEWSHL